jgi:ankyrin repeat protein
VLRQSSLEEASLPVNCMCYSSFLENIKAESDSFEELGYLGERLKVLNDKSYLGEWLDEGLDEGTQDEIDHIRAVNRQLQILWQRTLDDSILRAEEFLVGNQSWQAELLYERILAYLEPCPRVYSLTAVSALMAKLIDLYERRGELWAAVKMQERLLATRYYPLKEFSFDRLADLYRKLADREKELLQSWVDTNAVTSIYKNPILSIIPVSHRVASVRAQKTEFFTTFFDGHPNQHTVNIWGQNALHSAARQKNYQAIHFIVERNIYTTTASDILGQSAMHLAVKSGCWKTVNALIKQKCDINEQDCEGDTPLHVAVANGNLGILMRLINASADLSLQNSASHTPLHTAIINSNFEAALVLLQNAADISETDGDGDTLLHTTLAWFDEDVSMHDTKILVELLLKKGADACAKNKFGHTPLRYVIKNRCIPDDESHRKEIINLLIAKGANLTATDKDGRTPLHWALMPLWELKPYSRYVCLSTIEFLIQQGAQVYAKDKDGNTAMHIAAEKGRPDIVAMLLKHLARPRLGRKQTPYDVAFRKTT